MTREPQVVPCSVKLPKPKFYKSRKAAVAHAGDDAYRFNRDFGVGDSVCVHRDSGETLAT